MECIDFDRALRELEIIERKASEPLPVEVQPDRRTVVWMTRPDGTTCTMEYERDRSLFCPHCAARSIWRETGDGDYYVGVEWRCSACGAMFRDAPGEPDDNDRKIAEQLR